MLTIESFFDQVTSTVTHLVIDVQTNHCAVIDSVLSFNPNTGVITTTSADQLVAYVNQHALVVDWILETHIHADHLTAAGYLQRKLGGKIGVGAAIVNVLAYWIPMLDGVDISADGSQFDVLFQEGDTFQIGGLTVKVIATPGHTPDCVSYYVDDVIFVGDTIFMPSVGTGRTDFPGGSADALYHSIQKIFCLPDSTRIYTCHDYPPAHKQPTWVSTVHEQKMLNVIVNEAVTRDEFIVARTKRDENKPAPRLLCPSIQVNLRAGKLSTLAIPAAWCNLPNA